jgi:Rrf2 family protein
VRACATKRHDVAFWPSATADYALRALILLAGHDRHVQAGELHRRTGIPQNYVDNVMTPLRRAGLVTSRRGHHGGYRLARPATDITIYDIVAAIDDLDAPRWLDDRDHASRASTWLTIADGAFEQMRTTTLDELMRAPTPPPRAHH